MKKLTRILALLLVLVMGVCAFTACSPEKKVEKVVKNFMDSLTDGDIDKAADYCDDDALELVRSFDGEDFEGMKYEITDVDVDGETATVEGNITLKGEDPDEMIIELEKDGSDWVIVELDA